MTSPTRSSRPRPRSLRSGAFCISLVVAAGLLGFGPGARPVVGQEPDTVRADPRAQLPQELPPLRPDSAAQDTASTDTAPPPPPEPLPELRPIGGEGWAYGVWEWSREDLLRLPDVSLLNLLERVPGMVPVRADIYGQPEGAGLLGATAGAIRYVVDGFVLDPLTSPTFDPSRISLLALERVRIERGVTAATVRIQTLTPDDGRTKSVIEAGTGDYGVNLFRGMFLPPRVFGGPLGLGFERLSVDGFTPGTANQTVSWLKWTWARDSAGIQLEYRQATLDREGVGEGVLGSRAVWTIRARRAVGPVTGEAYVGAATVEDELGGEGGTPIREGATQGGVRLAAALAGPVPTELETALRLRAHPRVPTQELEAAMRIAPLGWLALEGRAIQGWWSGRATGRWSARADLGPVRIGLRPLSSMTVHAFGEVFRGGPLSRRGPELALPAPGDSASFQVRRDGVRAGLALEGYGFELGGAAVEVSADSLFGFGLPLEGQWVRAGGGTARGIEAHARIPTGFAPLTIRGWFVAMDPPTGWLYLPESQGRVGLVYHHSPLPSGNLEFFGRLEHVFRDRMNVPASAGATVPVVSTGAYRATNLELTIRVLSVRAFLRWENVLHRLQQTDLPGFELPGQHILWGVKWEFWN